MFAGSMLAGSMLARALALLGALSSLGLGNISLDHLLHI